MSQSSDRIAHKWIYAEPDESYDKASYNTSYIGDRFYSYNSVLARKVNGVILINKRIAEYSNTSRGHHRSLLDAIQSNIKVFTLYWDMKPLDYYIEQIEYYHDKQRRARRRDYFYEIKSLYKEVINYCSVFKIDKRSKQYKQLLKLINVPDMEVLSIIIQSNISAHSEQANERREERRQKQLNSFLSRDDIKWESGKVYMKIDGDKLKLSNQITVPLKDSIALYKRWISGKPILGIKFDQYTILKSSAESFTAGCTTLTRTECDRVYSTLTA